MKPIAEQTYFKIRKEEEIAFVPKEKIKELKKKQREIYSYSRFGWL